MGAPEKKLTNEYLAGLSSEQRMFRINAGTAWIGQKISHTDGFLILKNARPFHGAPKGWPDLFGWETIEITPQMVGQKIAVATGVEVKATGNLSPEQKRFGNLLEKMGGIFRVLRS